jgi:hypothetical protein
MKEKYTPSSGEIKKTKEIATEKEKALGKNKENDGPHSVQGKLEKNERIESSDKKFGLNVFGTTEGMAASWKKNKSGEGNRLSSDTVVRLYVNGNCIWKKRMEDVDGDMIVGVMSKDQVFMMENSQLIIIQIINKRKFLNKEDWRVKYRDPYAVAEFKSCESIEYQNGNFIIKGKDHEEKPLIKKVPLDELVEFDDNRDE